jgi:hypothetical protein
MRDGHRMPGLVLDPSGRLWKILLSKQYFYLNQKLSPKYLGLSLDQQNSYFITYIFTV